MAVKHVVLAAAGAVTAVAVVRTVASRRPSRSSELDASRWRVVTVLKSQEEVTRGGELPQPLLELGDSVEVRLSDAPGDRGTEIAVRLREAEPHGASSLVQRATGSDPRQAVRRALRETKQLLEAGEVIRLDPKPEGRRRATPGGALVDLLSARSSGEGVL